MNTPPIAHNWELRFDCLFDKGHAWSFPCDINGLVDLDALSERARDQYFYARAVVGRDLAWPTVQASVLH